ncbi:LuxR family transcriptional regulator [Actinomadura meridiana]|uniref:LuxR family transcriptional regulator n=1 Tax=Actinomadura meridiana TaxID=559626 RepID=A0ABP8C805_9ACTN
MVGRGAEVGRVERLVDEVRAGAGGALVVRGEPGIGKSALLDYAAERAARDMLVLRVTGIEGEAEMPYSALQLLLRPVIDKMGALPDQQARALRGAFGTGPAEDVEGFLVGLGTVGLLGEAAAERSVLCVVDDGHWIDAPSIEAVRFAARRIGRDAVGFLVATGASFSTARRLPAADLPVLRLEALPTETAKELLARESPGLPVHLRDRVLAAAGGNPLALLELPKTVQDDVLPNGALLPVTDRLRRAFRWRIDRLGERARLLLVMIAAEDTAELGTVMRGAAELGVPAATLTEVEQAGLVVVSGGSVRCRYPLVRTVAYSGASFTQQQAVHQALAKILEDSAPNRAAWHLAAGTFSPDERVAAALERTAESAVRRNGQAAAAAVYQRAAQLSEDDGARARRLAAAAVAALEAGQLDRAEELAAASARRAPSPVVLARITEVRGRLAYERGHPLAAARVTIDGATEIAVQEPSEAAGLLVRAAYYAEHGVDLGLTGEAVALLDTVDVPAGHDLRAYMQQSRVSFQIITGQAIDPDFFSTLRPCSVWEKSWTARMLNVVGDAAAGLEMSSSMVAETRAAGMMWQLANGMFHQACAETVLGRHRAAIGTAEAALPIAVETGQGPLAAYLHGLLAWLAALAGDGERCATLADEAIRYAQDHGTPPSAADATWALALLDLGHGRFESALSRMENRWPGWPHSSPWIRGTADHIEAAVRAGAPDTAARLLDDLERGAREYLDPCAPAIVARCRALAGPAEQAEENFVAALRPGPCDDRPFEQARTLLAFGRWLRREHRRAEARVRLRAALEIFQRAGAVPWAEQAQSELRATGDRTATATAVDRPRPASLLTPQQLQVVRLAATGATNREIGTQLFLSPRTVAQHLYRAYPKLGVTTRTQLATLDLDE